MKVSTSMQASSRPWRPNAVPSSLLFGAVVRSAGEAVEGEVLVERANILYASHKKSAHSPCSSSEWVTSLTSLYRLSLHPSCMSIMMVWAGDGHLRGIKISHRNSRRRCKSHAAAA